MALKKEQFDVLPDEAKVLYVEKDGEWHIKPIGDVKALEEAKAELDRFKAKHGEAEKHRKEQERIANESAEKAARASGDLAALEKSWGEKLAAITAEKDGEVQKLHGTIKELTVGASATAIAAELFGKNAKLMMPHINSRLSVEVAEGQAKVRVLGLDGKPSAATLDDFKTEIRGNEEFAPWVVVSNASGGGPHGGKGQGGASKMSRADFDKTDQAGRSAFIKEGGQVFD